MILWRGPICGDNGYIHGWQCTLWDRRPEAKAAASRIIRFPSTPRGDVGED